MSGSGQDARAAVGREARRLYKELNNWRKVGEEMGVTGGMAYRLANDEAYEPKGQQYRFVLGLPALIPAPACPNCGIVHLAKGCPARRRPAPHRVAIRIDDPSSAARTILKHVEPEALIKLVDILTAELYF